MKKSLHCLLILGLIATVGCETTPPPAQSAPSVSMDANSLDALRASLRAQDPNLVIAGVGRVLPSDDYLALANADTSDFPAGTPVSVIDSNGKTLAHGSVTAIVDGEVHIHFTTTGARRPQTGDAAIPFPKKR